MLYDSLENFVGALRAFKEKHPKTAIVLKDDYKNLRIGFEAIVDKDVSDDTATEWSLPLSKFKAEAANVLTVNEDAVIKRFLALRAEYNEAEKDYLNAFTGGEKHWDLGEVLSDEDKQRALKILMKYAKILENK